MDNFQCRYLAHQDRKKKLLSGEIADIEFGKYDNEDLDRLLKIMSQRRSRRIYTKNVSDDEMKTILRSGMLAPSSCNRKAIEMVETKDGIENLVGGRGWIEKEIG